MSIIIISAFLLGIGGSIHCLGMCGPLVMSIPLGSSKNQNIFSVFSYHIAKATGYGLMGLIMGLIGCGFSFMEWQQVLSVVAGIFILLMALYPFLQHKISALQVFQKPLQNLYSQMQHHQKWYYFPAIGFLNAFLPCGLVYTALAGAAVTATAFNGFIFMFFFGLGTIPALAVVMYFKNALSFNYRNIFKKPHNI